MNRLTMTIVVVSWLESINPTMSIAQSKPSGGKADPGVNGVSDLIENEQLAQFKSIANPIAIGLEEAAPRFLQSYDFRVYEWKGWRTAQASTLLPPPPDPNDLFKSPWVPEQIRMGNGVAPAFANGYADGDDKNTLFGRFKAMPYFGVLYDTNDVGKTGLNPATIPFGNGPGSGQTKFSSGEKIGKIPISTLFDSQMLNASIPALSRGQVQFFVDANNYVKDSQLRVNNIFGRVWNAETTSLLVGKTDSLFSAGGLKPATLSPDVSLVGTTGRTFDKIPQFRVQQVASIGGGWGWGIAIEDPDNDDFDAGAGTKLTRWPTLACNLVHTGEDAANIVQISSLVRPLGMESTTGQETFATAWGLAAYARIRLVGSEHSNGGIFLGVAGGQGIGTYINGVSTAAVFDNFDLSALNSVGAYAGYNQEWSPTKGWKFATNAAYGYAALESTATLAGTINEQLRQAFVNFVVFPNDNVAIGFEYQFGDRFSFDDRRGEDHRFMLVFALTSAKTVNAAEADAKLARAFGFVGEQYTATTAYPAYRQRL